MKRPLFIFLTLSISGILYSCEQGYSYNYQLTNNSDTIISVYFRSFSQDTSFTLIPGDTKMFYSTFHGMEGFGGPFKRSIKNDIKSLIVKKGRKISNKNYLNDNEWFFDKKNDFKAVYKAVITNKEFRKP